MKILLVNPTRTGMDTYISPPLHLVAIATSTDLAGHQSEILDVHYLYHQENPERLSKAEFEERMIRRIVETPFDILGVGSIIVGYGFTKRLVAALKERRPEVPVIIGGGMSMALKALWESRTQVDFLVESDGEVLIQRFLEAYPDREKLAAIPGLHCRDDQGRFTALPPELPRNLDYLPYPDWNKLPHLDNYLKILKHWINMILPTPLQMGENDRVMPIVASRGCPFPCTFCYHVNRLYRHHSEEYLIGYLRHLKDKFGVTCIFTWDDLIMVHGKWLKSLCNTIADADLGIRFFTSGGKANLVTRDVLQHLRKANFVRISFGIESGSQKILDVMQKRHDVEDNFNAVKMAVEEGIFVHLNMILGMPGEDRQTLRETEQFLLELARQGIIHSKNISFSFATGYPGTDLYDHMVKTGLVGDTEQYLMEQTGLMEYKYNMCGMSVGFMNRWKHWVNLKVDFLYHLHQSGLPRAASVFLYKAVRNTLLLYMPQRMKFVLRRLIKGASVPA